MATAPNLPGTGRVIGLAYDKIGRVLVKRINRLAVRFGLGPDATAARIRETNQRIIHEKQEADNKKLGRRLKALEAVEALELVSKSKPFRKDLKRLLKYARYTFHVLPELIIF